MTDTAASSATSTARQWVAREPGDLDVFELREVPVPEPGPGEVTVEVRAAGVNPADAKHVAQGTFTEPRPVGYELSGVVTAVGPGTEIVSGPVAVGDEVVAFRVQGGWASAVTIPASDVLAKPARLTHPEAANLLLAGSTAAEMLHRVGVGQGDTVVVHGASSAVGVSLLQQARLLGVRVVGTAGESRAGVVSGYGGVPTTYGEGVEQRLRDLAPAEGYAAALDCVGTDEAVDVSLALVADRSRVLTIAAPGRAEAEGFVAIAGAMRESAAYRDTVRPHLVALAGSGDLEVPLARTYPLAEGVEALRFVMGGHPGGKVALVP